MKRSPPPGCWHGPDSSGGVIFLLAVLLLASLQCAAPVRAGESGAPRTDEAAIILREDRLDIDVRYPRLGQPVVDNDLARWAAHSVAAFRWELAGTGDEPPSPADPSDLTGHDFSSELQISSDVSYPSPRAATVIFGIWSYTGGAHGNVDIATLSYDMVTGARLEPEDMFADLPGALALLAAYCYGALAETLGADRSEDMLRGGVGPDADNYARIELTPEGVRVHFPPYQVAPWSAGPQMVDVPLARLMDARPRLELWGMSGTGSSFANGTAPQE